MGHFKAEDGGTAVSYKMEYTLSDGAEGQAMDGLVAERANEISMEQSLNKRTGRRWRYGEVEVVVTADYRVYLPLTIKN
jgi:hypothetical protein